MAHRHDPDTATGCPNCTCEICELCAESCDVCGHIFCKSHVDTDVCQHCAWRFPHMCVECKKGHDCNHGEMQAVLYHPEEPGKKKRKSSTVDDLGYKKHVAENQEKAATRTKATVVLHEHNPEILPSMIGILHPWKSEDQTSFLRSFQLSNWPLHRVNALAKLVLANRDGWLAKRPVFTCYGNLVAMPRDVGFFSDVASEYKYSGTSFPARPLCAEMKSLLADIKLVFGGKGKWNGILVNLYHSGKDCTASHFDNEKELDPEAGVITLSAGIERKFRLRDAKTKAICFDMPLCPGRFLQMHGPAFQKYLKHEVPREAKKLGWRCSFTLRAHET